MICYVLVGLRDCDEQQVVSKLLDYEEVVEAYILFGEWDIIAKLEVESPEAAGTFVMDKVRSIEDVNLTSTLIVAK